jgi:glycosyltransferase involved in cell wall biosynthesis
MHADAIVAVSKGAADGLADSLDIERERISVIYNPVITPSFLEHSTDPLAHKWFKADEPPVIVGMGSLYPLKDFPTLVRAFAQVRTHLPCRLFIMGEGEQRKELEDLAEKLGVKEDVLLPGFIANPFPYLRQASVFVLSSLLEGLGNVLIEAMALGVPCVATNCKSGPDEILAGGKYGALIPVGDVEAMAAAIESAIQRPRARIPETAWQSFTLAAGTDAYERILG